MKNTHISEIMSNEKLSILQNNETLGAFLNMKGNKSNCYIVNEDNILQGVIDERAVLKYTAPLMAIVDQKNSRNLMERIQKIPLSDVIGNAPRPLSLKSSLHDVLQYLHLESCNALPVLDEKGGLIGEITISSIFRRLGSELDCCEDNTEMTLQAV